MVRTYHPTSDTRCAGVPANTYVSFKFRLLNPWLSELKKLIVELICNYDLTIFTHYMKFIGRFQCFQ